MTEAYNYNKMKANYEVIKTFCNQYRYELTVLGGIIIDQNGLGDQYEYIKFMNDLTNDEFCGNYLSGLLVDYVIDMYKEVNSGKKGFFDWVEELYGEDVKNKFLEVMNSGI